MKEERVIRIGTRESRLAMWQADMWRGKSEHHIRKSKWNWFR